VKLAFTTLGCPQWNMATIIEKAVEYGYDGVDFRGYLGEMDIYKLPEFSTNIEQTKQQFKEANLEVPCFSSSVRLFTTSEEELQSFLDELAAYAELCTQFNAPYIRVFGGGIGNVDRQEAIEIVSSNLKRMLPIVEAHNIELLLETHDDWLTCEQVETVLAQTDSSALQVLWDVHHPYRMVHESPEKTWDVLGDRIRYTHWKDSYLTEKTKQGYQLCLMGEGDIPLKKMYDMLKEKGYDGYFTFEWEKVWWPDIEEPEIAFKNYTDYMNKIAST